MTKLIFLCGPNGVGKSAVGKKLNERLYLSTYVDSDWYRCMNPYSFQNEMVDVNVSNMPDLLKNYINSDLFRYVVWTYGLHGRRREIYEKVMSNLKAYAFQFMPFRLSCEIVENIERMKNDRRDEERIRRAIEESRELYDDCPYEEIDTTGKTIDEVAEMIIDALDGSFDREKAGW